MTTNQNNRHVCHRTDIVRMFFAIANAIRTNGKKFYLQQLDNGICYSFELGNKVITYTVQEGGQA